MAVAADIKRMFHQVFVSPEDRGALCYLWWPDGDLTKDPKTFQMLVHIFGATSSSSICGYALGRTAADNSEGFSSETVDAVMRDFYVDDLLKSRHPLRGLLPKKKASTYNLRNRTSQYPKVNTDRFKNSYINRLIFKYNLAM